MRSTIANILVLGACFLGLCASRAAAEEIVNAKVRLEVRPNGCGFVDGIRFGDRQVLRVPAGFAGGVVTLAPAGQGTADSLFAHAPGATLRATIEDMGQDGKDLVVRGAYADGKLRVPFVRRISPAGEPNAIAIREEAYFSALDRPHMLARHELRLPLAICDDPHVRMFGFGAGRRAELFRMDMNDINRGGTQLISAPRGHWPYWDLGGVVQLPGSFRIWRANHADTMAYPIAEGAGSPGWADYSELDWGVTAVVDDPNAAAPWAITFDARQGLLSLAPRPAGQPPLAATATRKRTFAFRLIFHETSWPATYPCELPFDLYRALLIDIADGGKAPFVLSSPLGTADPDVIIRRERLQPSTILRTLYRGDAWRMQGRMRTIGVETPRNQPMADWEKAAATYLGYIRKNGLPKRAK